MTKRLDAIREKLHAHGQAHLLSFAEELPASSLGGLLDQIESIDFDVLDSLIETYVRAYTPESVPTDLEPAPCYPNAGGADLPYDPAQFRAIGEQHIRDGRVAAFTVAGGQGTRLGWNGPKGTYPCTVVTGKPLFRVFAEQIEALQRAYRATIPWYIMTSPINDDATRAFFEDNNCFGLRRQDIFMFPQGVMPSLGAGDGRVLLAAKDTVAVNPDGHGGSIKALSDSGAIDDMLGRGVEHISYFQVDNPLVKVLDPLFIGLHVGAEDSSGEMSSKMVPKSSAEEKVGVFCRSAGKNIVVEYSDLPEALAREVDDAGRLRFRAGSIAIHMIGVAFVQRLTTSAGGFALPYHRAVKAVEHVDPESGAIVKPPEPNAVKLETFVFDALRFAESSIVYETGRTDEFAPIKNASGADSPKSSHQLQSDRHGAWLEARGVEVPRTADGHVDARIEISPLTALEPDDLSPAALPPAVNPGDELVL